MYAKLQTGGVITLFDFELFARKLGINILFPIIFRTKPRFANFDKLMILFGKNTPIKIMVFKYF